MGACARWVRELTRGADHLRTVAHKIRAPVLLLQAGDDIFVHNHLHTALLRKMTGVPHCNMVCLKNAMHEIMVESDDDRDVAMGHMREFICSEQPGRNQAKVRDASLSSSLYVSPES